MRDARCVAHGAQNTKSTTGAREHESAIPTNNINESTNQLEQNSRESILPRLGLGSQTSGLRLFTNGL